MAIRIAVCDDEITAVKLIETYLNQISLEGGYEFEVFYFNDAKNLLKDMPRDIQILLLDIEMKDQNGIDVARQLRSEGLNFYLFYITSYVQYAIDGYEVHAYAFLRKPLSYTQLKTYLTEVVNRIEKNKPSTLKIKTNAGYEIIDSSNIVYIEVYGHNVFIICTNKRINSNDTLNNIAVQLEPHGFFRCHKSYLINMQKVENIRLTDIVMSNKDVVPLSKYRKREFLIALQEVIGK